MNVCIIGDGLTSLSLAKNLINKKINVHIYHTKKISNLSSSRTIGISKNNLEFFEQEIFKLPKKITWKIKKIEIYSEKRKKNEILNFENNKENLFFMIKNRDLYESLNNELSKNKLFKKKNNKNNKFLLQFTKKKYL